MSDIKVTGRKWNLLIGDKPAELLDASVKELEMLLGWEDDARMLIPPTQLSSMPRLGPIRQGEIETLKAISDDTDTYQVAVTKEARQCVMDFREMLNATGYDPVAT